MIATSRDEFTAQNHLEIELHKHRKGNTLNRFMVPPNAFIFLLRACRFDVYLSYYKCFSAQLHLLLSEFGKRTRHFQNVGAYVSGLILDIGGVSSWVGKNSISKSHMASTFDFAAASCSIEIKASHVPDWCYFIDADQVGCRNLPCKDFMRLQSCDM